MQSETRHHEFPNAKELDTYGGEGGTEGGGHVLFPE